jgi:hypothetical protein
VGQVSLSLVNDCEIGLLWIRRLELAQLLWRTCYGWLPGGVRASSPPLGRACASALRAPPDPVEAVPAAGGPRLIATLEISVSSVRILARTESFECVLNALRACLCKQLRGQACRFRFTKSPRKSGARSDQAVRAHSTRVSTYKGRYA